jgi:hypothetical protein
MKATLVALTLLVGSFAQADGFECHTASGLNVKIYNHTSPEVGTRVPAVMIVSDSKVSDGRKTIATFPESKGVLTNEGNHVYVGKVDLRMTGSDRKGELLAGTKLGNVDRIMMQIDFSYAFPSNEGVERMAWLTVLKRDKTSVVENAICARYLKN